VKKWHADLADLRRFDWFTLKTIVSKSNRLCFFDTICSAEISLIRFLKHKKLLFTRIERDASLHSTDGD
jgi:hypothetical protein